MNSQRKRDLMYIFIAAVVFVFNFYFGGDILAFIGRYVVFSIVLLACFSVIAYFLLKFIFIDNGKKIEEIDAENCPDIVEVNMEEE